MAGCCGDLAQGFTAAQICRPGMRPGQGPHKGLVWFGLAIPDNNLPGTVRGNYLEPGGVAV